MCWTGKHLAQYENSLLKGIGQLGCTEIVLVLQMHHWISTCNDETADVFPSGHKCPL